MERVVEYVHYGNVRFIRERFKPITNKPFFTKPYGGFWASRVGAIEGWKEWCENEQFRLCEEGNSFRFFLNPLAKVLHVRTPGDLKYRPLLDRQSTWGPKYLDFEALVKQGWDAVELHLSDWPPLYDILYGWDCDSILIMNPDIVIVKEEVKNVSA